MNLFDAMDVSATGLSAQRTRLNLATSNLANAETTRGPDGKPYKRMDPVFEPIALGDDEGGPTSGADVGSVGVAVSAIEVDDSPGQRSFMPGHPDADADGFVTLPNVDPIHEVVNLLGAQRGYEANATAFEGARTMAQRALEILS
jgi:flagellar basal-body rod protein FlgC